MIIFPDNITAHVAATDVHFNGNILQVTLSDGRVINLPLNKIPWLAQATPDQQNTWSLEPGGYAIYWQDLDDGLEVAHLMGMQPLA